MAKQDLRHLKSFDIIELCEHLSDQHHRSEKELLKNIDGKINTLSKVDRSRNIPRLHRTFHLMALDLEQHIGIEERIIFPFAVKMAKKGKTFHPGNFPELHTVVMLMMKLCRGQENILEKIAGIRKLTDHYNAPVGSAPTRKSCYEELQQLDCDIQQHFFIENNILLKKLEEFEWMVRLEESAKSNLN
ncbi:MAG TPA: hemerythrin domain-containing protein [Bacteroidia bacterium]|jgi:iron-sulfur cluster repair protein YtfE (RIC family)